MKFCDKVKKARKDMDLTQQELADAIGVSLRTITNYELGMSYPKKRELYHKLAGVLNVDTNYLLTEDDSSDAINMSEILEMARAMFAGGSLSEEDARAFVDEIQGLYLEAKKQPKNT